MALIFSLAFTILTCFAQIAFATDFNFGSGLAAKSENAKDALITAMERSGDRIFAVGVHGIVIYSDDEGDSWTQAESVPYMNTITDISCPSIVLCWATGHDATILHSNDGGKNWVVQYEDFDFDAPLLSIHMFDELHGVAVGAFALSLRTTNGGKSWGFLFVSEDDYQPHINYAFSHGPLMGSDSASQNGYAVGELGKFYLSPDKGLTWMTVDTGYEGSLWSGIMARPGLFFLLGMSGNIVVVEELDTELNDEPVVDAKTGFACYEGGRYDGNCKIFLFDYINTGVKNSLTNAIMLSNASIAMSGNGGAISTLDINSKRTISTCVRSDRLSNTSLVQLKDGKFLLSGEKGIRKHDMNECYENSISENTFSQDSFIEIDF